MRGRILATAVVPLIAARLGRALQGKLLRLALCLRLRRVVIPGFVRREMLALVALSVGPLDRAPWANASGPEGVPHSTATGKTLPPILGSWAPTALGAEDLGLLLHVAPRVRSALKAAHWEAARRQALRAQPALTVPPP